MAGCGQLGLAALDVLALGVVEASPQKAGQETWKSSDEVILG